jgi:hypothetical protein
MTIIDEKNKEKVKNPEPPDSGEDFTEVLPRKIIDFELITPASRRSCSGCTTASEI